MMTAKTKRPTDWRKRFDKAKPARTVVLHTDFAGIKAGSVLFIGSPGVFANYVSRIPAGETRAVDSMRNELARRHAATATCPVTTAIYMKVVAELAISEMNKGAEASKVIPFWRIIEPGSKIARRLSCGDDVIMHLRALESGASAGP